MIFCLRLSRSSPAAPPPIPFPLSSSSDSSFPPIVPVVMDYFLSFIQTRDPNPLRAPGAPVWESWGTPLLVGSGNGSRIVLETNNVRMEPVEAAQAARCEFWAGLAPRTQQKVKRSNEVDLPPSGKTSDTTNNT